MNIDKDSRNPLIAKFGQRATSFFVTRPGQPEKFCVLFLWEFWSSAQQQRRRRRHLRAVPKRI
jgi:hypothetical protein